MLDFLKPNPAVALLKEDHDRVKDLFDRFEAAKGRAAKRKIVRAALTELKVHAAIEEELFYPAVRKAVGKEVMTEADEEHHVAKLLIAELDRMDGSESHFDAKFRVLAENVRHHIKEEEDEMLPKAKTARLDFNALAEKMTRRKERLLETGVPPAGEAVMVKAARGRGDSPARAARRKPPKLPKARKRQAGRRPVGTPH
jgi:Hemerythrin HHE cation binding domain